MGNIAILADLIMKGLLQLQQYQLAVSKAVAEGRDVTDEEVAQARANAVQAIDDLEQMP